MHCYTKPERISHISNQVFEAVRSLIAAGISPETTNFVQQSKVLEHANLAWYLSCLTKFSRAENMTQFKSNVYDRPNVGLFIYPILQAADILIYSPDHVFVGPDQQQHLELATELCDRANRFSKTDVFKRPNILSNYVRIMSLKNGEKKMSKSEPDGCLFLTDEKEELQKKILKAKTDGIIGISYEATKRKYLANLINILALMKNRDAADLAQELCHLDHFSFKMYLSKEIDEYFMKFKIKYRSIHQEQIKEALDVGTREASKIASLKLQEFLSIVNK